MKKVPMFISTLQTKCHMNICKSDLFIKVIQLYTKPRIETNEQDKVNNVATY
jgi:hypothetical protein